MCNERDEGEGGWGEKFSNQKYKEGTCTKMSHEQIQMNTKTSNWTIQQQSGHGNFFTEVLDTFVIVTAHKQVCANQQCPHP